MVSTTSPGSRTSPFTIAPSGMGRISNLRNSGRSPPWLTSASLTNPVPISRPTVARFGPNSPITPIPQPETPGPPIRARGVEGAVPAKRHG